MACFLLGISVAANASAIRTASSSYGDPTGHPAVNCVAPTCTFPVIPGVTMTEQDFAFSFVGGYEAFYFTISGPISNFTLTLTGDANFIADDTVNNDYIGFGARVCPGDPGPPCSDATQNPGTSDGTENQVSFNVPGSGDGFSFFAVEKEDAGVAIDNFVTANITLNTTSTVPEPSLFPILGLAVVGLLGWKRYRSAKLA
jgi:hypothetical protein